MAQMAYEGDKIVSQDALDLLLVFDNLAFNCGTYLAVLSDFPWVQSNVSLILMIRRAKLFNVSLFI